MLKHILRAVATCGVISTMFVAVEAGTAGAVTHSVLTGIGELLAEWRLSGTIRFTPPLFNGGTATAEKMVVSATLGNSASPCITTGGIVVTGTITGNLGFSFAGANDCATIFSGASTACSVTGSKSGHNPDDAARQHSNQLTQPSNFTVKGALALNQIKVTTGTVSGSFSPFLTPKAVLSDVGWPTTITAACASTSGLSHLGNLIRQMVI